MYDVNIYTNCIDTQRDGFGKVYLFRYNVVIATNILENVMDRRLERNTGEFAKRGEISVRR